MKIQVVLANNVLSPAQVQAIFDAWLLDIKNSHNPKDHDGLVGMKKSQVMAVIPDAHAALFSNASEVTGMHNAVSRIRSFVHTRREFPLGEYTTPELVANGFATILLLKAGRYSFDDNSWRKCSNLRQLLPTTVASNYEIGALPDLPKFVEISTKRSYWSVPTLQELYGLVDGMLEVNDSKNSVRDFIAQVIHDLNKQLEKKSHTSRILQDDAIQISNQERSVTIRSTIVRIFKEMNNSSCSLPHSTQNLISQAIGTSGELEKIEKDKPKEKREKIVKIADFLPQAQLFMENKSTLTIADHVYTIHEFLSVIKKFALEQDIPVNSSQFFGKKRETATIVVAAVALYYYRYHTDSIIPGESALDTIEICLVDGCHPKYAKRIFGKIYKSMPVDSQLPDYLDLAKK